MKYHLLVYDGELDINTKDSIDIQKLSKLDVSVRYLKKENQMFKKGALYAFYLEIMQIPDNEVVILLIGGNRLAHEYVLKEVDRMYADDKALMTYGGSLTSDNDKVFKDKEVPLADILSKKARGLCRSSMDLMTFYSGLFKKIPLTELLVDGFFPEHGYEYMLMLPMLEIAEERAVFCRDVLHISSDLPYNKLSDYDQIKTSDSAIDNIL